MNSRRQSLKFQSSAVPVFRQRQRSRSRFQALLWLVLVPLIACVSVGSTEAQSSRPRHRPVAKDVQSGFYPGAIEIFAGNGNADSGFADGSLPTNVAIGSPSAIVADSQGNIFFAGSSGDTLYVVYGGGTVPALLAMVTTQASTPVTPVKGDIYQVSAVTSNCNYCYQDGIPASQAFLNNIQGLALDAAGDLYIAAGLNMYSVFEVDATSTAVHVIAGQFDLPSAYAPGDTISGVQATSITLSDPTDVKVDSYGNIYIADEGNIVALVVYAGSQPPPVLAAEGINVSDSDKGNIYTIAGQVQNFCGGPGICTDAGPANDSLISGAISLTVDAAGNVYILDNYAYTVRAIYAGGTVPPLLNPVNPQTGYIYTVAGLNSQFTPCSASPCGDGGAAADIQLNAPLYLAVDAAGNAYIDDSADHAIRKVDIAGVVSTVAGIADPNATVPAVPTGGAAATATVLNLPGNIAFDAQNNLYISDESYDILWEVGPSSPQTITFPKIDSPVTYGNGQIDLDATASSGLAVQYSVSGPAVISGSGPSTALNVTGAGTVVVTANQPGNAEFGAAPPVSQTIIVNKASLLVSAVDASKTQGSPNPPLTVTYSGFVGSDTQATSITGQPSVTTTATPASPSGTYPITVSLGSLASNNYAFTFANGTLTVTGSSAQTITFAPLANVVYGQQTIALSATASSDLPVQFVIASGPATVSGKTINILGAGTIVVVASQPGNDVFAAAPSITRNLVVTPAPLTVTAPTLSYPFGTTIDPSTFPPPTITGFVGSDTASLITGTAQYTTNASGTPPGGTYTLTVAKGTLAVVPAAAANYTLANFVAGSLTIAASPQTISSLPLPAVSYNTLYTVTASASSGLPVKVTASGPIAIYGSNVTDPANGNNSVQFYANGVGPAALTLTQAGTADYAAATPVILTFNANKAELDIQANNLVQEQGAPTPTLTYTIGANVQAGPLGGFVDIPSVVSGIPTLTTSATPNSPAGAYPIIPSAGTLVSPVYFFKFINGTLTVTPAGSFTITANPSTLTLAAGMSAQSTLTLTPVNTYQGTVTLGCGPVPSNVTCAISPATYNFPGSQNPDGSENPAQGTITISASSATVARQSALNASQGHLAGLLLPGAIAGCLMTFARKRFQKRSAALGLCLLLAIGSAMLSLASCGGSNSSNNGLPSPGTSTVMIQGSGTTPSGASQVTATASLTITIQ